MTCKCEALSELAELAASKGGGGGCVIERIPDPPGLTPEQKKCVDTAFNIAVAAAKLCGDDKDCCNDIRAAYATAHAKCVET